MSVKIWHNPRCSKSRQTLALLEEKGVETDVIPYLETPPSVDELKEALGLLNITASDFVRSGEAEFKDQGLKDADEATLIEAMAKTPRLIQRPVVFANGKAAIGRPPEDVLDIL